MTWDVNVVVQLAAVVVSIVSAAFTVFWSQKIHREGVAATNRSLELLARQVKLEEQKFEQENHQNTVPKLVLHVNSDGIPCVSNISKAAAMHTMLDFSTVPGPSGSFSLFTENLFPPGKEVPLNDLANGFSDGSREGIVKLFSEGPTGFPTVSRQKFRCRMDSSGHADWMFPKAEDDGKVKFEAAAGNWVKANDEVFFEKGKEID